MAYQPSKFIQWQNHPCARTFGVQFDLHLKNKKVNVFPEIIFLKVNVSKVQLATVVEGNPNAPFSIATTPRCRGGRYSFPWIVPLYPLYVPHNAKC